MINKFDFCFLLKKSAVIFMIANIVNETFDAQRKILNDLTSRGKGWQRFTIVRWLREQFKITLVCNCFIVDTRIEFHENTLFGIHCTVGCLWMLIQTKQLHQFLPLPNTNVNTVKCSSRTFPVKSTHSN